MKFLINFLRAFALISSIAVVVVHHSWLLTAVFTIANYGLYDNLWLFKTFGFELVRVTVYMQGDKDKQYYFVVKPHVNRLLKAFLRLHWQPGVNPYTGRKTSELTRVIVEKQAQDGKKVVSRKVRCKGTFWWATPDLKAKSSLLGALLFDNIKNTEVRWGEYKQIWPTN